MGRASPPEIPSEFPATSSLSLSLSPPQFPGFDDLYCKFSFVYGQDWVPTAVQPLCHPVPTLPDPPVPPCPPDPRAQPAPGSPPVPCRVWRRESPRSPPRAASPPPRSSGTSPSTSPSRAPTLLAVSAGEGVQPWCQSPSHPHFLAGPQIVLSVYGPDFFGHDVVRGYGAVHVPFVPGR